MSLLGGFANFGEESILQGLWPKCFPGYYKPGTGSSFEKGRWQSPMSCWAIGTSDKEKREKEKRKNCVPLIN